MDLEKKINDKPGFFKRIARKALPYVFAAGLGLAIMSCKVEPPGPISVENTITPELVSYGGTMDWEVKVTNNGGKVTIDQARVHERAIFGSTYDVSEDLPITDYEIAAHSTETIYNVSKTISIEGDFVGVENTVTVSSNGGDDSDTCTYMVLGSPSP